ncbi:hypothetical protein JCM10207_007320 [Rhodosporidiobolus poonsookiae]
MSALLFPSPPSLTCSSPSVLSPPRSDHLREDLTSKAQREAKPSSQETVTDKAKDTYESAASTVEPQSQKGHRQAAADEATESHTHGPDAGKSIGDKVKHALHLDRK